MIGPLAFAAPFALLALAALPALYYLLRLTPPPPQRIILPTLPLVRDLVGEERQPTRTPLWLLLLRIALAAALILAIAGPRLMPTGAGAVATSGPLVVFIDNGWASAADWRARLDRAIGLIEDAGQRPVAVRAASEDAQPIAPDNARLALEKARSLAPVPHTPDRVRNLDIITKYLASTPESTLVWVTDGVALGTRPAPEAAPLSESPEIARLIGPFRDRVTVIADETPGQRALSGFSNERDRFDVRVLRAGAGSEPAGLLRALDARGRPLAEVPFAFPGAATEATVPMPMPLELRNDVARLEIAEARTAGAAHLVDASSRRRRVALVTGESTDTQIDLVSGRYFALRALGPYSELREPPRGAPDPVARALEDRPDVVMLVDIGTLAGSTQDMLAKFVEEGGVLIRFAGPGLAAGTDALLPVRIRRGGRIMGGALSWDKPQRLAPFGEASPFSGLALRDDVLVERQVLAEPDPELGERTWASLADGTPLVTAAPRGKGMLVLYHVTADTAWSNLPLSGLFVDMLRRTIAFATLSTREGEGSAAGAPLPPRVTLDAFGVLGGPPATAKPLPRGQRGPATADHPPGFYGPPESSTAVNVVPAGATLAPVDLSGLRRIALGAPAPVDLRPLLFVLAVLLVIADMIAVLWLSGRLDPRRFRLGAAPAALALGLLFALPMPEPFAQQVSPPGGAARPASPETLRPDDMRSSLRPRLAFIVTGNAAVDETSRRGLEGLTRALSQRTALDPDEPIGLDPARDALVFYPLIYWPLSADQKRPAEGALKAIDAFMKQGGTIVFDTRDAGLARTGAVTPETRLLREILATLDIPPIEPVPRDHVLTKTFYLLEKLIGRYAMGESWVELVAGASDAKRPARAGDRVSPIVITSNDLAAGWATDAAGRAMFPMVPGEPRQREMALRTGINLVMYAMTGNYKADQVHVPALLERLGQ